MVQREKKMKRVEYDGHFSPTADSMSNEAYEPEVKGKKDSESVDDTITQTSRLHFRQVQYVELCRGRQLYT